MRKQGKRRAFAVGLAVVLSVGLMPTSALAANAEPSVVGQVQPSADEAIVEVGDAAVVTPAGDEPVALSDEGVATEEVVATVNGQGYPTLAAAIAEADTNGEVLLEADVNEVVNINSPITLNLQGHSITADFNYALFATANVAVTGSGSISGTNYGVVASGATVTLNGVAVSGGTAGHVQSNGKLVAKGRASLTGTSSYGIYVGSGNTAEIVDATVSTSGTYGVINFGTVTMSDGTVTGTNMGVANLGTFRLEGGTVGDSSTKYGIVSQGGTATVMGGTVTGSIVGLRVSQAGTGNIGGGLVTTSAGYAVEIEGDISGNQESSYASTVNMTNGSIVADQGDLPCGVAIFGNGATLKMRGGSINAAAYAISGNGVAKNAGTTIEIGGGSITSTGDTACAIYHPQSGTLKINGMPTITGSTGVQLCSGSGVAGFISGGKIVATGTDQSAGKTGDGVVPDGSAISILDRDYPGGTPSFKIVGGVFRSQHNDAVTAYTWDGTARSDWEEADEYVSIEGGLFYGNLADSSKATAPRYVAVNHAAVKYDSTGYRVGKLVTLTLNGTGANDADVTYEVKANTADSVSGVIAANSEGEYTLVAGSEVSLNATADDDSYIVGWAKGGTTLSSMSSCVFQIINNSIVTAQLSSSASEEAPVVSIAMTEGSVAYNRYYFTAAATCNVPSQYEVVKVGIRSGESKSSLSDVEFIDENTSNQGISQAAFALPTSSSKPLYLQAYVVVRDSEDVEYTIYSSNMISVTGSQHASYTDVLGFVPTSDTVNLVD